MELKVCGLRDNIGAVAHLDPDYIGLILWPGSARHFDGALPELPEGTRTVGVFVDPRLESIHQAVERYALYGVQLHGSESPDFIQKLRDSFRQRNHTPQIIKAFAVGPGFAFETLSPYIDLVDAFLFDTKGPLPGGNGSRFDWSLLEAYPYTVPYFLSGGIGPDAIEELRAFLSSSAARHCTAIDVNSKFESAPGLKDIDTLISFKESLWNT